MVVISAAVRGSVACGGRGSLQEVVMKSVTHRPKVAMGQRGGDESGMLSLLQSPGRGEGDLSVVLANAGIPAQDLLAVESTPVIPANAVIDSPMRFRMFLLWR